MARSCSILVGMLGVLACGPESSDETRFDPGKHLRLVEAVDLDPHPNVTSVKLRAAPASVEILPGIETDVLAYSGSLPGPLIRAKRGDRIRIEFENGMSLPTTVHWHGMRVPNDMDGVPHHGPLLVQPGAGFVYEFDALDASLFWYHPHHYSLETIGAGLYGPLLVEDPDEPELGDEVVLVLSDISLDQNGALYRHPNDRETVAAGRDGNVVLVNGRMKPRLEALSGRRQRWRIVNSARSRYFRLSLPGHTFIQIGSDHGRIESPIEVAEPLMVPGERLDLLVEPRGEPGTTLELRALPVARGNSLPQSELITLLEMEFVGVGSSPPLPDLTRPLAPIDATGATVVEIGLTMGERDGVVEMGINGIPYGQSEPLHARVGETQVLRVMSESGFSHPFHLHGFVFQELDANGVPVRPLKLKDTIEVPPLSVVDLAVTYDNRPGIWMFHCHILDHAEAGMMGELVVSP
ncbi:MAG: multicopper oxidase family protein [Pseudomonadota bacterium]